jgi:hypothetical protein
MGEPLSKLKRIRLTKGRRIAAGAQQISLSFDRLRGRGVLDEMVETDGDIFAVLVIGTII